LYVIRNIDARVLLAELPDASIDLIVTDPPYRTIPGGSGPTSHMHQRPAGMLSKNDGRVFAHNDIDVTEYAGEFFRVLRSPAHLWLFCNELNRRPFEDAMLSVGFQCHGIFPWVKQNATPNRWGMKNWEPVFLFRKGPARTLYTPGMKQALMVTNPIGNKAHPTEKPVDLLTHYIEASSVRGQVVLDPFMGSGSTGVACAALGRHFIGGEIDPEHYTVAKERMSATAG
jgi:DNA modification methylase